MPTPALPARDPTADRAEALPSRRTTRAAAWLMAVAVLLTLGVLFERSWRHGEVFSPADAIFAFFPWAYDLERPTPSNLTRTDEAFFHQPLMMTHWSRLRAGEFPEWDPHVLAGTPAFLQGLDTGRAFSPLSLPFYLAPPDIAVTIYAPLRLACAAWFMWLFLRRRTHSALASAGGALAFAVNGAFIAWLSAPMPTVALFLPLIFLAIDRVIDEEGARPAALLALALGLSFLGAYLPTSIAVSSAAAAYALVALLASPGSTGLRLRTTGALIGAGAAGLALAAVALVPMLTNLVASAAAGRSMRHATLPWTNLATFAAPDFWGSPLTQTWWYPATGNYPEFVTYLGIAALALAGAGLAAALRGRDVRALTLAALGLFSLGVMYGWPPFTWLTVLPGYRQMNPFRWNVVLACAVAVLVAVGLDALRGKRQIRHATSTGSPANGRADLSTRWWAFGGAVLVLFLLGGVTAAATWQHLDDIRRLNLQPLEKTQLIRFAAIAAVTLGLCGAVIVLRSRAASRAASVALLALLAADLVQWGYGFNPTIPRTRLYPVTDGIVRLQAATADGRAAPVDPDLHLVPGHIWSVFGIDVVTGYDFFGDGDYQRFIDRVAGTNLPTRWDHVTLGAPGDLDLRLLGLLNVTTLVTAPVGTVGRGPGYSTVGELTSGRRVEQRFAAEGGLRGADVLVGLYDRENTGTLTISLARAEANEVIAERTYRAADLRDNAWMRLECPPQPAGTWVVRVSADGAEEGHAATVWTTGGAGASPADGLTIDGVPDERALIFRTFTTGAGRLPGAPLAYSGDLNIYRNPQALPRAWFVSTATPAPAGEHLDRVADPSIDLATTAVVAEALPQAPTATARVRAIDISQPDVRSFDVDAPDGGVLVVSERFASGWRAEADGRPLAVTRANSVLLAVGVPAATRQVRLVYRSPTLRPALAVSALTLSGISLALFVTARRRSARR